MTITMQRDADLPGDAPPQLTMQPLSGKGRQAIDHTDHRIVIWEGSIRSSKTVGSLIAWLTYTRQGPAGNLVMVGRTKDTLKRNILDPLVDWLGEDRCRLKLGAGEVWIMGRRIYAMGANDEQAAEKIRGATLAGAYVDEITVLPESYWIMLLGRLSIEGARLYGTTNPDSRNHWLMRDYLAQAGTHLRQDGSVVHDPDGMDLARLSFRLADNPTLPGSYIESLKREYSGLWYRRFILGEWVIAEGSIYDMYDPDRHVRDTLPVDDGGRTDIGRWILAIDYGTVNPFSALLMGVDTERRDIWVAAEYRHDSRAAKRQLTDAEYSAELRRWLVSTMGGRADAPAQLEAVVVDPSAASFLAQLHRDNWGRVRGADNTVDDGIREVASLLGADRLKIHTDCSGLLDELPGYAWDPKAALKGEEKPIKEDDHSVDALRYGVRHLRRWWRHWVLEGVAA